MTSTTPFSMATPKTAMKPMAAGTDIGSNADGFTFVYQTLDGDGEIIARLADLERTHPWAKAGLMFRDELAAQGLTVELTLTPIDEGAGRRSGSSTTLVPA